MRRSLLEYVVCPACHSSLMLRDFSFERGEIREGVLMCEKCGREYPIIGFLPILTSPAR